SASKKIATPATSSTTVMIQAAILMRVENLSRRRPPLPQLLQQRLRFLQVRRVEAFGEPAVDWREEVAGFGALALVAPEAGKAGGGAQFVRPRPLMLRYAKRLFECVLALLTFVLAQERDALQAVELRIPRALAGGFLRLQPFLHRGQRGPMLVPKRERLSQEGEAGRPSIPHHTPKPLAQTDYGFVDRPLCEESPSAEKPRLQDPREALFSNQGLGRDNRLQGRIRLAAIEVKHRHVKQGQFQAERVRDALRQRQSLAAAGQ